MSGLLTLLVFTPLLIFPPLTGVTVQRLQGAMQPHKYMFLGLVPFTDHHSIGHVYRHNGTVHIPSSKSSSRPKKKTRALGRMEVPTPKLTSVDNDDQWTESTSCPLVNKIFQYTFPITAQLTIFSTFFFPN